MKLILLTQGKFAKVDDADFDWLNQWKWFAHKGNNDIFYASRTDRSSGKQKTIRMHRFILNIKSKRIKADHRNHDGLDNQRHNIRKSTKAQNNKNRRAKKEGTSNYLGVHLHTSKHGNKCYYYWEAKIRFRGKSRYLGAFKNEIDAAIAYDSAAKKYHGDFANLNFK